jgi:hypothetical protein
MKKYHFYADPGHGWLKVAKKELVELGIADKMTCSYMLSDYAYLEEDCDAGIFANAIMAKHGIDLPTFRTFIVSHHTNNQSPIRNYPSYQVYNAQENAEIMQLRQSLIHSGHNWSAKAIRSFKTANLDNLKHWAGMYLKPATNPNMKKVIIRKRTDLKYMPSYKWESLGWHEDGSEWFSNAHRSRAEAVERIERLKKSVPDIEVVQDNPERLATPRQLWYLKKLGGQDYPGMTSAHADDTIKSLLRKGVSVARKELRIDFSPSNIGGIPISANEARLFSKPAIHGEMQHEQYWNHSLAGDKIYQKSRIELLKKITEAHHKHNIELNIPDVLSIIIAKVEPFQYGGKLGALYAVHGFLRGLAGLDRAEISTRFTGARVIMPQSNPGRKHHPDWPVNRKDWIRFLYHPITFTRGNTVEFHTRGEKGQYAPLHLYDINLQRYIAEGTYQSLSEFIQRNKLKLTRPNPELSMAELQSELRQFTGTEKWHRNQMFPNSTYTDGIKYLAEKAQAFWLIDLILSCQHGRIARIPFQIWWLKVTGSKAVAEMRQDTGQPVEVRQKIPFTDFPQGELKLYYVNNVLLLPSEY